MKSYTRQLKKNAKSIEAMDLKVRAQPRNVDRLRREINTQKGLNVAKQDVFPEDHMDEIKERKQERSRVARLEKQVLELQSKDRNAAAIKGIQGSLDQNFHAVPGRGTSEKTEMVERRGGKKEAKKGAWGEEEEEEEEGGGGGGRRRRGANKVPVSNADSNGSSQIMGLIQQKFKDEEPALRAQILKEISSRFDNKIEDNKQSIRRLTKVSFKNLETRVRALEDKNSQRVGGVSSIEFNRLEQKLKRQIQSVDQRAKRQNQGSSVEVSVLLIDSIYTAVGPTRRGPSVEVSLLLIDSIYIAVGTIGRGECAINRLNIYSRWAHRSRWVCTLRCCFRISASA
jgi:hypothetical protein